MLGELEPDVEALLVNRARGARDHWLVPIDECYALVGLIRTRWRGFTGGQEVWEEIGRFFEQLDRRSKPAGRTASERRADMAEMTNNLKVGKPDVAPDAPAHTPGIRQGNSRGQLREAERATIPDGTSTAERSTGINAQARNPIDPRMPNLSPP